MEKIKFRGKTSYDNDSLFVYGSLVVLEDKFQIVSQEKPYKIDDIIPDTVGQFTCLTDKKGVEIYEGDIVIYDGKNSLCSFLKGSFVFGNEFDFAYGYEVEVIGNVYENPELLQV